MRIEEKVHQIGANPKLAKAAARTGNNRMLRLLTPAMTACAYRLASAKHKDTVYQSLKTSMPPVMPPVASTKTDVKATVSEPVATASQKPVLPEPIAPQAPKPAAAKQSTLKSADATSITPPPALP